MPGAVFENPLELRLSDGNKGVGSFCFTTWRVASLSSIPWGIGHYWFRKLPRFEHAGVLTATFWFPHAPIVIRLHRSRSILWARFFLQRASL